MNKTELVESIAEKMQVPKSEAQKHFEAFTEVVTDTLRSGDELRITGFGKFYVRERDARTGTNPQTKERINIPARKVPSFSAGAGLKEAI